MPECRGIRGVGDWLSEVGWREAGVKREAALSGVRHEARREITEILADCGNGGSGNVGNVSSLYTATGATTPTAPTALGLAGTCQGRPCITFYLYHNQIHYWRYLSENTK